MVQTILPNMPVELTWQARTRTPLFIDPNDPQVVLTVRALKYSELRMLRVQFTPAYRGEVLPDGLVAECMLSESFPLYSHRGKRGIVENTIGNQSAVACWQGLDINMGDKPLNPLLTSTVKYPGHDYWMWVGKGEFPKGKQIVMLVTTNALVRCEVVIGGR